MKLSEKLTSCKKVLKHKGAIVLMASAVIVFASGLTTYYLAKSGANITRIYSNEYQKEKAKQTADAAENYVTAYTIANQASVTTNLAENGGSYTKLVSLPGQPDVYSEYTYVDPNDLSKVQIRTYGTTADGVAFETKKFVTVSTDTGYYIPSNPITTKDEGKMGGRSFVLNKVNAITFHTGDKMDFGGDSYTRNVNGICSGEKKGIQSDQNCLDQNDFDINADISDYDQTLKVITDNALFKEVFKQSMSTLKASLPSANIYSEANDFDFKEGLNGVKGKVIYLDAPKKNIEISKQSVVGTANEPVIIIADCKKLKIKKDAKIYGFIYATKEVVFEDDTTLDGALVAEDKVELKDDVVVTYYQAIIDKIKAMS